MLYIDTSKTSMKDCGFYFGLEEFLIKDYDFDGDIFLLWNVVPTVMIGRHQVTTIEIDESYVKEHDIQVIRRNSGGGAVYTDLGCYQFSFITNKKSHQDIFKGHVHHIVDAVNKLGLEAEFTGRNDILHKGRKFSGNAEFIHKDKMVIHGTILFNSDMDHLIGSLTPDKAKLTKHAVTSVKSRVLNINEILETSQEELYDFIVNQIKTRQVQVEDLDLDRITAYAQKFYTDEWNYGKNPKFDIRKKEKFNAGNITFDVVIKNNKVSNLKMTGDFFSLNNLNEFENAFIGVEYTYEAFVKVLKTFKVKDYIYKLRHSEFLGVFFERPKRKMKPDYLKIDMKQLNKQTKEIRTLLRQHNLHTV